MTTRHTFRLGHVFSKRHVLYDTMGVWCKHQTCCQGWKGSPQRRISWCFQGYDVSYWEDIVHVGGLALLVPKGLHLSWTSLYQPTFSLFRNKWKHSRDIDGLSFTVSSLFIQNSLRYIFMVMEISLYIPKADNTVPHVADKLFHSTYH